MRLTFSAFDDNDVRLVGVHLVVPSGEGADWRLINRRNAAVLSSVSFAKSQETVVTTSTVAPNAKYVSVVGCASSCGYPNFSKMPPASSPTGTCSRYKE